MAKFICILLFAVSLVLDFSRASVIDNLKHSIQEARTEKERVLREIEEERKDILERREKCDKELKVKEELSGKGNERLQRQVQVAKDLFAKLVKLENEERTLMEAPQNIEKLKLGIKTIREKMEIYEKRRNNGMTALCLSLQYPKDNMTQKSIRKFALSMSDAEIRTLQVELSEAMFDLSKTKAILVDLSNRKQLEISFCEFRQKNLDDLLKKLSEDTKKSDENIFELSKAVDELAKRIKELQGGNHQMLDELSKMVRAARDALKEFEPYVPEELCFEKLMADVKLLANSKEK